MPKINLKLRSWILICFVFLVGMGLYIHSRYVTEKRDIIRTTFLMNVTTPQTIEYGSPVLSEERNKEMSRRLDNALISILFEVLYMNSLFALMFVPVLVVNKKREEINDEERKSQEIEIMQLQQICNGLVRKRIK